MIVLLLTKLYERFGTPLKDWDIKINYGIKTGCNEAFIIDEQKRNEILENCQSNEERERTAEIIRPILRGRDIKKNGYEWPGLYCILAYYGFHKVIDAYPAVFNHLSQFEDALKKRGQVRYTSNGKPKIGAEYPGQHHWLELDNNPRKDYLDDFSQQRFIWTAVNSEYKFLSLDNEIYYNNSIFHGVSNKSLGISSIMNSSLMRYYLRMLSSERYQYGGKEMMNSIPILINIENRNYTDDELGLLYELTEEEMNAISSSVK